MGRSGNGGGWSAASTPCGSPQHSRGGSRRGSCCCEEEGNNGSYSCHRSGLLTPEAAEYGSLNNPECEDCDDNRDESLENGLETMEIC